MHKSMDESKKTVSFGEVQIHGEMVGTEELKQGYTMLVPERSRPESPTKSNCQVFMFGFGTVKFPTKMELSDIQKRQLRQQTTEGGEVENDRGRRGTRRWWMLIDVFRCGGGYEGEVAVKDLQASFRTLKRFDLVASG